MNQLLFSAPPPVSTAAGKPSATLWESADDCDGDGDDDCDGDSNDD